MTYDEEFIDLTTAKALNIRIEDSNSWFELLERKFPIGLNRIAWSKVKNAKVLSLQQFSKDNAIVVGKIINFIEEIVSLTEIDNEEPIIILSDGALENVYSTNFSTLKNIVDELFLLPQHTYIIPLKGNWCLNYTFEDELFFGFSTT